MATSRASDDRAGGAAVVAPFVAAVAALEPWTPPTAAQAAAADPLVVTLRVLGGRFAVPLVAGAIVVACLRGGWSRASVAWSAAAGAAAAVGVVLLLRAVAGPVLPAFVPPEESARPGLLLGLSAGVVEEAVFRVALLPLLARRGRALAVVATGALFAVCHELPPAGRPFRPDVFTTRLLVPGCGMTALALALGTPFVVAAHCVAHLLLPLVFAGR
jgi:membrane protease YdiL (CAAX protease family)